MQIELDLAGLHEAIRKQQEFLDFAEADKEFGISDEELEPERTIMFFLCQHRDLIHKLIEAEVLVPQERSVN